MADADFYKNGDEAKKVTHEYKEIQSSLSSAFFEWGKVSQEIESVQ